MQVVSEKVPPFKHVLDGQGFGVEDGDGIGLQSPHKNGHAFLIGLVEVQDSLVNKLHLGSSCWHIKFEQSKPE